jgi:hypothetical protein
MDNNVLLFPTNEWDPIRKERLESITEFDHSREIPNHEVIEKLAKDIAEGIKNGTILSWLKDFEED